MMAGPVASPLSVDVEHLRRTLHELGYYETFGQDAAPLLHHVLTDLSQATQQYTEVMEHYDALFARFKEQNDSAKQKSSIGSISLDDLDMSMLGINQNVDESFMLHAVEDARLKIDSLFSEIKQLKEQNKILQDEKRILNAELQKSQMATQELSALLQGKHSQIDNLMNEMGTLRKSNGVTFGLQVNNLGAYEMKLSDNLGAQLNLASEVIQRIKREAESQNILLQEAKTNVEKLRSEQGSSEEVMAKLKAGIAQYQSQIAELNSRLVQREFEKSLQTDLSSQLTTLEGVNNIIKEKIAAIDRLKQNGGMGEISHVALNAVLDSLSSELNTEVCFTSHLNQIIEKLNKRRVEQDLELKKMNEKAAEGEVKISKLEGEKAEIRARLERTMADLASKEGANITNNEVVYNLRQALESKENKIQEQKRSCTELKTALDQCQHSMVNMRKNEEMIRHHVAQQDEEIHKLRSQMEQVSSQKEKFTQGISSMESELISLRASFQEKIQENQQLSVSLKNAISNQEKATSEFSKSKAHMKDLEEAVLAKRKEKDLLMTTYCRVIKENERLNAELQKLHEQLSSNKAGDYNTDQAIKAFQSKIQLQQQEIERLRQQLIQNESKASELEIKLQDAKRSKIEMEEEFGERVREVKSMKTIVSSMERSKKDLASQMARFAQQATELQAHVRRIEAEREDLQTRLKATTMDSPLTRSLQTQLATMTVDLEQTKSLVKSLERERDVVSQHLELEKNNLARVERQLREEKAKRAETGAALTSAENARFKLKEQLITQNDEYEKGFIGSRRHQNDPAYARYAEKSRKTVRQDNINGDYRPSRQDEYNYESSRYKTPSPPESPVEDKNKTENLRNQNKLLKLHLADIRNEIKETMSPGKYSLNPDLETSITALTSDMTSEPSSNNPSDDNNADLRRRLEHENRLLFKIVDKVKTELQRAGLETPGGSSSSTF